MKKTLSFMLVTLLTASTFLTSCKKGEDDPFLSVKSRKSRVVGEWKMISGTSTEIDQNSTYTTTTTITYSGTSAAESETIASSTSTTTTTSDYSYTQEFIFDKDGSFSGTIVEDGITTTFEGTWNFTGGVKEAKNKSQIILTYSKTVYDGNTYTYDGNIFTDIYDIKELRSKKMVLTRYGKYIQPNGDSSDGTEEWVFEPK
jgi:hypothetical protein